MLKLKNLKEDEVILMTVKRHWIVFVMLGIYFFSGLIVTFIIWWLFGFWFWWNMINIIIWLFFSLFLFIEWLNHELDMYIVTNNRIIWIEQIAFLNRWVTETNLGQVQEVNSKNTWLLSNLLNYWTLSIQTAWSKTTLQMSYCSDTIQTQRKILNIVDNYRDAKNIKEKQRIIKIKK